MRATHHGQENGSPLQAEYICADLPLALGFSCSRAADIHSRPSDLASGQD